MTYEDLLQRAKTVQQKYAELNTTHGTSWDGQDYMAGFVGDVGDLSKIVMAKHGLREMENVDKKLAHELADCLWSILVIADSYNVDLVSEFNKTMATLEERIDEQLGNKQRPDQ